MIQPVRPVGGSSLAVQYSALAAPLALRMRLVNLSRFYIPWRRLSLILALLDRSYTSKHTTPTSYPYLNSSACIAAGTITSRLTNRQQPFALDPWQPWPAHEPFTDEIKRWWPSDEVPSDEEAVILEQHPADSYPQFVLWPVNGGLLDTWV